MYQEFTDTLSKTVNPATFPVGVALLNEAPAAGLKFRVKYKKITVCQQIAYSRMYGWATCIGAEHSFCVLGAACAGLIVPPVRLLEGGVNCGVYQKDKEAAVKMQLAMPRVPAGTKYVVTFPLTRPLEGITAQSVVVYGNTAQAMRMIQAFLYKNGGELSFARGVAEVILKKKPVVEVPCLGDRRFAMTQDSEMVAAFPLEMMEEVCEGLAATHTAGIRYPIPYQLPENCDLPDTYTVYESDLS
jgi:uncharacterized protein (DUF169 family)